MSQIKHLLITRLVDSLTLAVQRPYATSNITRVNIIQAYRFQGDPQAAVNHCYVSDGDPKDPYSLDSRIDSSNMEALGITNIPAGEIGGGHLWWRRGRIVIGCYYLTTGFAQAKAGDTAHIVLGRIMSCVDNTQVGDLVDEFGECASKIFLYACSFGESGGPPDQYIWRGEVLWQALTYRPV